MQRFRLKRTTLLTMGFVAVLIGIGAATKLPLLDASWVLLAGCLWFGLLRTTRRMWPITAVSFVLVMFLFGWWRGSVYRQELNVYQGLFGKTVAIEAIADEDAVYGANGQITFDVSHVTLIEPYERDLVGIVQIAGFGEPMVYRGDVVRVEGKFFPRRGSRQASISFGDIVVLAHDDSPIEKTRREFVAGMQTSLPEPQASLGMGLLIGQRSTLPDDLNDALITVGLIHIVAVSGYNLTIIIDMVRRLLHKRSRFQTLIFSLTLIGVFLLFTGYSPSIVRAALVSSLSLIAWYFGRQFKPLLLIAMVAALTAAVNPLYVWGNIGWYLSFSAFFGVLVIAPLLQKRFLSAKSRKKILPSILLETLSAQLTTLPIILLVFSRLSVVSVLANVLVVPMVPLAMLFGLFAGLAGIIGVSALIVFPAKILLDYIVAVTYSLARVPHANVQVAISSRHMVYLYIVIVVLIVILQRKTRHFRDTITDEKEQ